PDWLREHAIDLVSVDVPDLPDLYPRGLVRSGTRAYIRLHSRNAANWYRGSTRRYDYDYADDELAEWVAALEKDGAGLEEVLFLFNNCFHAHAVVNARRLRDLLRRLEPGFAVVEPTPLSSKIGRASCRERR